MHFKEGLKFLLARNITKVEIEVDAFQVVQLIPGSDNDNHHLTLSIREHGSINALPIRVPSIEAYPQQMRGRTSWCEKLETCRRISLFYIYSKLYSNQAFDDARGVEYPRTIYIISYIYDSSFFINKRRDVCVENVHA